MNVFVYSARPFDQPALQAAAGKHNLIFSEKSLSEETADLAHDCEAVAIFTSDDASAEVLKKLHFHGVRYILARSVGFDHVDLDEAEKLGIRVANVPEYSPYSVAEHAVALLMALNRKLIQGQHLMARQDFRIDTLKGFDVHGKTVGIIGTGKIGLAFARIMHGFGANLLACDPIVSKEAVELGIRYVELKKLLESSDIVSIHCPLNSATKYLIAEPQFAIMKRAAILINTSRGAIIKTIDLVNALEQDRLGGACLDVYEFEKGLFFHDHRNDVLQDQYFAKLRSFSNVIITSHQGFLTTDAINEIAATTISNLDCWQNEVRCPNELTNRFSDDDSNEIVPKDSQTTLCL